MMLSSEYGRVVMQDPHIVLTVVGALVACQCRSRSVLSVASALVSLSGPLGGPFVDVWPRVAGAS